MGVADDEREDLKEVLDIVWDGEEHEWWHPHNGDTFRELAINMLDAGNNVTFTAEVLGTMYGIVSDEFGC